MDADLDFRTAARAIHLRILLSRSGAFRTQRVDGLPGALAVLPGDGSVARLSVMAGQFHGARLCYPTGRPLSAMLDLRDPLHFPSFLHNVDVEIHRGRPPAPPTEIAGFTDAVLLTRDQAVLREAEALFADGRALDFGAPENQWRLPGESLKLLCAARASSDEALGFAAEALADVSEGRRPGSAFDEARSLVRWHETADRLIHAAAGRDAETLEVGDLAWFRLATAPAVAAEARALAHVEGDLLGPLGPLSDLLRADRLERPDRRRPRFLEDRRQFWSLRDADGSRRAVAVVGRDGDLLVRGPKDAEGKALFGNIAAVAALRGHLGLDGPAPGP